MHDPMTVVNNFGRSLITIWHVDPETDGTDDSCGWFRPKLTGTEEEKVQKYIEYEQENILVIYNKWNDLNRMPILYTLYQGLKWHLYRERLNARDIRALMGFAWNIYDDIMIHTERPEQEFSAMCYNLARHIKRVKRKWWQHPRWHFRHWEFQVHPIEAFKRWAFSRCSHCGGKFRWGEAVISHQWHGTGPLWFKSEKSIFHEQCSNAGVGARVERRVY